MLKKLMNLFYMVFTLGIEGMQLRDSYLSAKFNNVSNVKVMVIGHTLALEMQNVGNVQAIMRPRSAIIILCNVLNAKAHIMHGIMNVQ